MDAKTAHSARVIQGKIGRKVARPKGNYDHSEHQWGVVGAIHPATYLASPNTVDLWLDGATQNAANLTKGVPYLSSYYPTINDVVLVHRGAGNLRSSRVVLGKLYGSPSPEFTPFGSKDSAGRFVFNSNGAWGGSGVPASTLGTNGDYYFRTDTPGTAGQRLYVKSAGAWVATAL